MVLPQLVAWPADLERLSSKGQLSSTAKRRLAHRVWSGQKHPPGLWIAWLTDCAIEVSMKTQGNTRLGKTTLGMELRAMIQHSMTDMAA